MNTVETVKMIGTKRLKRLNKLSLARNYNQNLSDEFLERVDPHGIHFVAVLLVHDHAEGEPVRPHFRCEVLARMRDGSQAEALLDLPKPSFQSLQDAPLPGHCSSLTDRRHTDSGDRRPSQSNQRNVLPVAPRVDRCAQLDRLADR